MRSKLVKILVSILAVILLGSCDNKHQRAVRSPEFVFFYAENQDKDYPTTLGGYKFSELVEERSKGRIKIIVQPDSTLGCEKEVMEQLQFGGIDFARISLSTLAESVPQFHVLQMPYLYTSSEHMWKVLDGEIGDNFMKSLEGSNMVALSWYDAGARNFYNSVRPIHSLEDMKGLKIRVQESTLMVHMVEALGAKAVPLVYSDVYSGLQRGTIDGAENNWPSYESTNHYKVAKYYTIDEHTRVPELQLCAQATWNKLSAEDREMIQACAKESALYERTLWIEREKQSKERLSQSKVEVIELLPEEKARFQQAVKKVYEIYCADYMDMINAIIVEGR